MFKASSRNRIRCRMSTSSRWMRHEGCARHYFQGICRHPAQPDASYFVADSVFDLPDASVRHFQRKYFRKPKGGQMSPDQMQQVLVQTEPALAGLPGKALVEIFMFR